MFENTPVDHETGQPAIDHCRMALDLGMHAITANKGTVVHGYRKLTELARAKNKKFLFESTVLGGSPLFSVFRETCPPPRPGLLRRHPELDHQHHPFAHGTRRELSTRRSNIARRSAWPRPTRPRTWTAGMRPSRSLRW
jgi:hypothetical protein